MNHISNITNIKAGDVLYAPNLAYPTFVNGSIRHNVVMVEAADPESGNVNLIRADGVVVSVNLTDSELHAAGHGYQRFAELIYAHYQPDGSIRPLGTGLDFICLNRQLSDDTLECLWDKATDAMKTAEDMMQDVALWKGILPAEISALAPTSYPLMDRSSPHLRLYPVVAFQRHFSEGATFVISTSSAASPETSFIATVTSRKGKVAQIATIQGATGTATYSPMSSKELRVVIDGINVPVTAIYQVALKDGSQLKEYVDAYNLEHDRKRQAMQLCQSVFGEEINLEPLFKGTRGWYNSNWETGTRTYDYIQPHMGNRSIIPHILSISMMLLKTAIDYAERTISDAHETLTLLQQERPDLFQY